jgi:hypothetical protein
VPELRRQTRPPRAAVLLGLPEGQPVSAQLRRDLTNVALELAAILNLVQDDDERDDLHGHVEKTINDALWAGSQSRQAVAPVIDLMERLRGDRVVVDIFSKRVRS